MYYYYMHKDLKFLLCDHLKELDSLLPFDIDVAYLGFLFASQAGCCALSGLKLDFESKSMQALSIDMIDGSLGFVRGNVQLLCQSIKDLKGSYSQFDVMSILGSLKIGIGSGSESFVNVFEAYGKIDNHFAILMDGFARLLWEKLWGCGLNIVLNSDEDRSIVDIYWINGVGNDDSLTVSFVDGYLTIGAVGLNDCDCLLSDPNLEDWLVKKVLRIYKDRKEVFENIENDY